MKAVFTLLTIIVVAVMATGCNGGNAPGSPTATSTETVDELKAGIENKHPSTYYTLAKKLFTEGTKDEAVFWFYLGQLRYRFYLKASKNLDPSGDPALFASLSEVVGRPLNEYAFGDIPKLAETIDKVLEWDETHDNGFTPKQGNEELLKSIRDGLAGLKDKILTDQERIKAQRKQNGLE